MKQATITLAELQQKLATYPAHMPVRVWLPGSTISLSNVFVRDGEIHIEGNLDPGSALCEGGPHG